MLVLSSRRLARPLTRSFPIPSDDRGTNLGEITFPTWIINSYIYTAQTKPVSPSSAPVQTFAKEIERDREENPNRLSNTSSSFPLRNLSWDTKFATWYEMVSGVESLGHRLLIELVHVACMPCRYGITAFFFQSKPICHATA